VIAEVTHRALEQSGEGQLRRSHHTIFYDTTHLRAIPSLKARKLRQNHAGDQTAAAPTPGPSRRAATVRSDHAAASATAPTGSGHGEDSRAA
jgi:hypothetical protein